MLKTFVWVHRTHGKHDLLFKLIQQISFLEQEGLSFRHYNLFRDKQLSTHTEKLRRKRNDKSTNLWMWTLTDRKLHWLARPIRNWISRKKGGLPHEYKSRRLPRIMEQKKWKNLTCMQCLLEGYTQVLMSLLHIAICSKTNQWCCGFFMASLYNQTHH